MRASERGNAVDAAGTAEPATGGEAAASGSVADGRVRRGARNREAILAALVDLYEEGDVAPTAARIAARAGVSARSVYGHFADMEALAAEVSERQLRVYGHLMAAPDSDGTRRQRLHALARRRAELWEAITPVRRAALLVEHRSPTIGANLRTFNARMRRQLARLLAPELAAAPPASRAVLLDAVDLATSWEAWRRLRTRQGLSVARARAVVVDLTAAAVAAVVPSTEEDRS